MVPPLVLSYSCAERCPAANFVYVQLIDCHVHSRYCDLFFRLLSAVLQEIVVFFAILLGAIVGGYFMHKHSDYLI